jgi:hypothetical protein
MVQKLQKFWFPINLVLWVTIIGNLILGIVSVIYLFPTLAWVEAFFNVVVAIIVLVWLNNLYKVLRFDTIMAELVSIQKYGTADVAPKDLDPSKSIEALIEKGLCEQAEQCLLEAIDCKTIDSAKAALLWEEIKERRNSKSNID